MISDGYPQDHDYGNDRNDKAYGIHDTTKALVEAKKLGIPIIAILDSNSNPDGIDFPIPGNDDARRSIDLYCSLIKETIISAKKDVPVTELKKSVDKVKEKKTDKTIQELDREKLDKKFSEKDKGKLN